MATSSSSTCLSGCFTMIQKKNGNRRYCDTSVTDRLKSKLHKSASMERLDLPALLLHHDCSSDIAKAYTTEKKLGEGGFGTVWGARSKHTGEERAIKMIPKTHVTEDLKYIEAEVEVMVSLSHPNVIKLYEFYEDSKYIYLVTELCAAGDFSELSPDVNEPDEIRMLFHDLFKAVAYCHDHKVAHRDLKFENCLITETSKRKVGKVIDFGLAAIRRPDQDDSFLSDTLGTKFFMAPEVVEHKMYGVNCDLWSVGVMLYIVLTGEHPCSGRAMTLRDAQLFEVIKRGRVRPEPLADVEPNAADLIQRLLVRDPALRLAASDALEQAWLKTDTTRGSGKWKYNTACHSSQMRSLHGGALERARSFGSLSKFEKAILLLTAHNSGSKQLEGLRACFISLDRHNKGSLSKDEVKHGMELCGINMDDDDLERLFNSLDADGSGRIEYTEWLAATIEPSAIASDKAMQDLFDFFDTEQSGHVSRTELCQFMEQTAPEGSNGDMLPFEEFKDVMNTIVKELLAKRSGKTAPASSRFAAVSKRFGAAVSTLGGA